MENRYNYSRYFGNETCSKHCEIVKEGKYFDVCKKTCIGNTSFFAVQDKSGAAFAHFDDLSDAQKDADKRNAHTGRVEASIVPQSTLERQVKEQGEKLARSFAETKEKEAERLEEVYREQWALFKRLEQDPPLSLVEWYNSKSDEFRANMVPIKDNTE